MFFRKKKFHNPLGLEGQVEEAEKAEKLQSFFDKLLDIYPDKNRQGIIVWINSFINLRSNFIDCFASLMDANFNYLSNTLFIFIVFLISSNYYPEKHKENFLAFMLANVIIVFIRFILRQKKIDRFEQNIRENLDVVDKTLRPMFDDEGEDPTRQIK